MSLRCYYLRRGELVSKKLTFVLSLLFAVPAFAGTALSIGMQPTAPVQIVQTSHGLADLLTSARFENRSTQPITAYRIGWVSESGGRAQFEAGTWMALPAGVNPGAIAEVPAQRIQPKVMPEQITVFVSEVKFEDGSCWKATRTDLGLSH